MTPEPLDTLSQGLAIFLGLGLSSAFFGFLETGEWSWWAAVAPTVAVFGGGVVYQIINKVF